MKSLREYEGKQGNEWTEHGRSDLLLQGRPVELGQKQRLVALEFILFYLFFLYLKVINGDICNSNKNKV